MRRHQAEADTSTAFGPSQPCDILVAAVEGSQRNGLKKAIGEWRGRPLGSLLEMPWAKDTLANYLTDTIRKVSSKPTVIGAKMPVNQG